MPLATEEALRIQVLRKLRARGGEWITYPRTAFGHSGVSDVIGCYHGRFVALELKRPGDHKYGPTRTQLAFQDRVRAVGGYALVTNNWEKIEGLLDVIDRCAATITVIERLRGFLDWVYECPSATTATQMRDQAEKTFRSLE